MAITIAPQKNIDDRINDMNKNHEPMITRFRMIKLVNDIYRCIEQINIVIPASDVSFDPSGTDYSATNVQDALVEAWAWLTGNEYLNSAIDFRSQTSVYIAETVTGASISLDGAGNVKLDNNNNTQLLLNSVSPGVGSVNLFTPSLEFDIDDTANKFAFTGGVGTYIDAGSMQIKNLAAGTAATDAINLSQLTSATSTPYSRIFMLMGAST